MSEYIEKLIAGEMYYEMMAVLLFVPSALIATVASGGSMSWVSAFFGALIYMMTCAVIGTTIRIIGKAPEGN